MSLSIIIPAYNESDQVYLTAKKLNPITKKISNKYKKVKVYKNIKKGLGPAIEHGILKSSKENICIFMCDLSDDVQDIYKYYKCITNDLKLDAVFGSWFTKDSKIIHYPYFKLVLNRFANNFIKILFLSNYNDFTNAFKIYKKKTILKLFPIVSENFNIFLELPLKIIIRNYNYKTIPINWYERKTGKSKFKIKVIGSMYMFTMFYCLLEKILLNKRKK